jgi:hypothetical protein
MNMRKSTTQKSSRQASKPNGDAIIIGTAVAYAQAVAAFHNGFKADPDGDMKNAAKLGKQQERIASDALARLASIPANSAEALDAKARILPMILDDDGGSIEENSEAFYRTFAADVRRFLEPIIHEHWLAENAERQKKAA